MLECLGLLVLSTSPFEKTEHLEHLGLQIAVHEKHSGKSAQERASLLRQCVARFFGLAELGRSLQSVRDFWEESRAAFALPHMTQELETALEAASHGE